MRRLRQTLVWVGLALWGVACCRQHQAPPQPPAAVPGATATSVQVQVQPKSTLPRTRTDAPGASLVLTNKYPLEQHVFIAGTWLGSVPPGSTVSFPVPLGNQEVRCSDSRDPTNNPTSFPATFESGFAYTYLLSADGQPMPPPADQ